MIWETERRIDCIDLFRGAGIILMIMGHINFGKEFDFVIHAFHMPMFFFVSGLFFKEGASLRETVKRKAETLLVPYAVFAFINWMVYCIINNTPAWDKLMLFLRVNTENLPIAGALWFLTALFFCEIGYSAIDRAIPNMYVKTFVYAGIAAFGNFAADILPFRLPWALDAAFVGMGLYHAARLLKTGKNKFCEKVFDLPLLPTLLVGFADAVLIHANEYVNMRQGAYGIVPLFWINALLSVIFGINLCRIICRLSSKVKLEAVLQWIRYMGSNSIIFVCLNQLILTLLKMIPAGNISIRSYQYKTALLFAALIILTAADFIIRKTPAKIILGIFPKRKDMAEKAA